MASPPKTLIQPNNIYHIYNRGNGRRQIFSEPRDFTRFLYYVDKYLIKVGHLYAYALMDDHFHLLVGIKSATQLPQLFVDKPKALGNTFGHIQNAYAKYYLTKNNQVSGLFERSYERKLVSGNNHFQDLVDYLHQNPVKHEVADHPSEYQWTSYLELKYPELESRLNREFVWERMKIE